MDKLEKELRFKLQGLPPARYKEFHESACSAEVPRNQKLAHLRTLIQRFTCTYGLDALFDLFNELTEAHDGKEKKAKSKAA